MNYYDEEGKQRSVQNRIYDDRGVSVAVTPSYRGNIAESQTDKIMTLGNYTPSKHNASRIEDKNGIAPTVMENHGTITAVNEYLRIRKLTPKECWRLMGWKDEQIDKIIKSSISNTQMYKQAGNGIVVSVLEAIFKNLLN